MLIAAQNRSNRMTGQCLWINLEEEVIFELLPVKFGGSGGGEDGASVEVGERSSPGREWNRVKGLC